ncbi:MAG: class I SAM-dependent methyltransferase [Lentimicrobium sp.]|nr:class I SAM-dependent methyltransferase [Lentimicrobium sp.]
MEICCPLCRNLSAKKTIPGTVGRIFYLCDECMLVFADPAARIADEDEKYRNTLHENSINNKGYIDFLNQVLNPALKYIDASMTGLDFGCGPDPTINLLLKQKEIECDNYNPFFFFDLQNKKYDFIFATECFEHFNYPAEDINKIAGLLKKGGFLFILTSKRDTPAHFSKWTYARDLTHVSFYHERTFEFIAKKFGFNLIDNEHQRFVIVGKE